MKVTDELLIELSRCLHRLTDYTRDPGEWYHSETHASLHRATLDLSRVLSKWRKTQKTDTYNKEYK